MPYSCRKWIYRTAKVRSNDQAGLCGARAPGHAGIYLTGSLRSPLPGRGGPGAPRVYGQTRAEVLIGLPAAAPRRRNEWAPARSSHGARIKKVRRRIQRGGSMPRGDCSLPLVLLEVAAGTQPNRGAPTPLFFGCWKPPAARAGRRSGAPSGRSRSQGPALRGVRSGRHEDQDRINPRSAPRGGG